MVIRTNGSGYDCGDRGGGSDGGGDIENGGSRVDCAGDDGGVGSITVMLDAGGDTDNRVSQRADDGDGGEDREDCSSGGGDGGKTVVMLLLKVMVLLVVRSWK